MLVIVLGALLPDISLFIMFGYAQLINVPNELIWSDMYYSAFWQQLGAMTNSVPIYLISAIISWAIIQHRLPNNQHAKDTYTIGVQNRTLVSNAAVTVLISSLASALHVATDLPLHHDDGHPHFWPFTNWIYESPISYWDAFHFAGYWVPIDQQQHATPQCLLSWQFLG